MTSHLSEQIDAPLAQGIGRQIAATLRRRVLAGEFEPGERLSLGDIQREFGVSVIPVREALTTLEAEGLVRTLPRRGTRVASLTLAELDDVYTLRRLIEPSLSAAAARTRSDDQARRARAAYELMESIDGSETDRWLAAHRAFHWSLLEENVGEVTARTLRQLWGVSDRYVRLTVAAFRVDRPAGHDHARLIEAFERRDGEQLARDLDAHLELVRRSILRDFSHHLTSH